MQCEKQVTRLVSQLRPTALGGCKTFWGTNILVFISPGSEIRCCKLPHEEFAKSGRVLVSQCHAVTGYLHFVQLRFPICN